MLGKLFSFVWLFIKFALSGTHKPFVLCSLGCGRHPAVAHVGTRPRTPTLWDFSINFSYSFYFNADAIISNICATAGGGGRQKEKKRKKKERKERLCLPRSWQICWGEDSLLSSWVGVTDQSESLKPGTVLHWNRKQAEKLTAWQCPFKNDGQLDKTVVQTTARPWVPHSWWHAPQLVPC